MPRAGSTVIHPRLLEHLAVGYFPHTCRIEQAANTRSSSGQVDRTWAAVPGMEAIPCNQATKIAASGRGGEIRSPEFTVEANHFEIALAGAYRSITPDMRCVLDTGEIFDITATATDSQNVTTILSVRLISPAAVPGF